jgi:hypothetical protein
MNRLLYVVAISTLTIALPGRTLAQVAYAPGMPGNGQLQTRQQPYYAPAPVPRPRQGQSRLLPKPGGQDQSHLSPDPRAPQLGPPLGGYDAPVKRSEPDYAELETCFSAAVRRLKETATVTRLMAACSIEVDQWMDQCVRGGTSASSCASLWGSLAADAQRAAQGGGYRPSVDWEIENAR